MSWGCFAIYTVLGGGGLGMFGNIKIAVAGEGWNVIVFAQFLMGTPGDVWQFTQFLVRRLEMSDNLHSS